MKSMNEIDLAVKYLRENAAIRDGLAGLWALPDGVVLGVNPIEAAHNLRTALIQKSIDNTRNSGGLFYFTR